MDDQPFVLLVEDDPANRGLASRVLSNCGYSHAVAIDGQDALDKVAERRPDLILMDLSMPGMDGWEATRRLRADPANATVRVLALTAHAMRGDREKALDAGCDDVLTKPYRPTELIEAVRRLIGEIAAD
ncbi:MAG: response regulator [Thermomicrobiales bacterium]|nr:response regulator [Thermomicrobiales bacterium]